MIISVEEFRKYVSTDLSDEVLETKLKSIESLIRKFTNNNFQNRKYRTVGDVEGHVVTCDSSLFKSHDTIMIDDELANVKDKATGKLLIEEELLPDEKCLITKVEYPIDVQLGAVNLVKWDLSNGDKVGIQSETISRHSVTFFNLDGENSSLGYPKSLVGFLKPYMKASF